MRSLTHSNSQPTRGGIIRRRMSTRMCCPCRSNQGAEKSVIRYKMFSETSLLQAMPPIPRLRVATSAPISSVMNSSSRQAASIMASKTRPKTADMRCMSLPQTGFQRDFQSDLFDLFRELVSERLGEKLLQFRAVLWTLLDDAGPAGLIGFVAVCGALAPFELDHLNAGGLLLGDVCLVFLCGFLRLRLEPRCRIRHHLFLRGVQLIPAGLVDQD